MHTAKWLILVAVVLCGCQPNYDVQRDLRYTTSSAVYGFYDVYQAPGDDERTDQPAVAIAIHGGGWMGGDKSWGAEIAHLLCPHGYVVLTPTTASPSDPEAAPWPAQIEDVQAALRYFRGNARALRIDQSRIASIGVSAGGNLASMLALRDDPRGAEGRVQVAVDLDGEQDMTQPGHMVMSNFTEIMRYALGHPPPFADAELRDISPVFFARPTCRCWWCTAAATPTCTSPTPTGSPTRCARAAATSAPRSSTARPVSATSTAGSSRRPRRRSSRSSIDS